MAKRLMCVLLSVLMVVAMLPMGAVADEAVQTSTGILTILDGADFTDEELYLYIHFTMNDGYESTDYIYWSLGYLCTTDDWSESIVSMSTYSACGGTYCVSLVDIASAFETAGYDVDEIDIALNFWGSTYGTFTSAELVRVSVESTQDSTGTMTILDGVDFTDEELYLYIYFTMNDEYASSNYIYWSLGYLCTTDDWSESIVSMSTYSACGGTYCVSLVDIASAFETAGYDVNEIDIALNFWGSTYGTFTSAELVRVSVEEIDAEEVLYQFTSTSSGDNGTYSFNYADYLDSWESTDIITITATLKSTNYFNGGLCANDGDATEEGESTWTSSSFESSSGSAVTVSLSVTAGSNTGGSIQIWWLNGDYVNLMSLTMEVTSTSSTGASFYGKTLSLGGKIGVNFYVDFEGIDSEDRDDYSVKFTVDDSSTTLAYSEASTGSYSTDDLIMFTCEVPCWEMGTTITAELLNGDTTVDSCTYSVATYATNMVSSSTELGNLVAAMLEYGNCAAAYKGESATVEGVEDNISSVDSTDLEKYAVDEGLDSDIIMASLTLDETCELSFTLGDGYSMTIDGVSTTSITDILVQNWDYEYTIVVTDSDDQEIYSFSYSVLSYAYTVVDNSDSYDDELVDLVKSMYLYNVAADAYVG